MAVLNANQENLRSMGRPAHNMLWLVFSKVQNLVDFFVSLSVKITGVGHVFNIRPLNL
jgi:hypothetical protein